MNVVVALVTALDLLKVILLHHAIRVLRHVQLHVVKTAVNRAKRHALVTVLAVQELVIINVHQVV